MDILEKLEDAAFVAYGEVAKTDKAQISPAVIAIIIEVVVLVVKQCMERNRAQSVVDNAKRGGVLARFRIRQVMQQIGVPRHVEGENVVEAVLKLGGKATVKDVRELNDVE